MDITGIKRPEDLDFEVPPILKNSINELLAALEREDWLMLDCYQEDVIGCARWCPNEEDDYWVYQYYGLLGCLQDVEEGDS